LKTCARPGCPKGKRDPENCGDPGRRCGRYSPLAGADEDRTPSRLSRLLSDLIDPAIAAHHGRIVKRTGAALALAA
jgi:hypothetical protein